jgi:hypothetical protein
VHHDPFHILRAQPILPSKQVPHRSADSKSSSGPAVVSIWSLQGNPHFGTAAKPRAETSATARKPARRLQLDRTGASGSNSCVAPSKASAAFYSARSASDLTPRNSTYHRAGYFPIAAGSRNRGPRGRPGSYLSAGGGEREAPAGEPHTSAGGRAREEATGALFDKVWGLGSGPDSGSG